MNFNDKREIAWNMMVELRKEVIQNQISRAQTRQIQFTFIGGILGGSILLVSKEPDYINFKSEYSYIILLIVCFSSICFDFIALGYNASINRIGRYIRKNLEINIYSEIELDLWETHIHKDENAMRSQESQFIFGISQILFSSLIYFVYIILYLNNLKYIDSIFPSIFLVFLTISVLLDWTFLFLIYSFRSED